MFGVFLFTRFQASIIRMFLLTILHPPIWSYTEEGLGPSHHYGTPTLCADRWCALPYGVESRTLEDFCFQEKAWKLESDRTGVGNSFMNSNNVGLCNKQTMLSERLFGPTHCARNLNHFLSIHIFHRQWISVYEVQKNKGCGCCVSMTAGELLPEPLGHLYSTLGLERCKIAFLWVFPE